MRELEKRALQHTEEMGNKYKAEIQKCVQSTIMYTPDSSFAASGSIAPEIVVVDTDSVSAILAYSEGKTAILNFASYKHAGGGFINGMMAQEEALCHSSFLYNVLKEFDDYYKWNRANTNKSMYLNRALYSPDVIFEREEKSIKADVITCAAPNKPNTFGGNDAHLNDETLESRIRFVADIARENKVDTLILGAYGCGVFSQSPGLVSAFFKKHAGHGFKKVVYAIPSGKNTINYTTFKNTFEE